MPETKKGLDPLYAEFMKRLYNYAGKVVTIELVNGGEKEILEDVLVSVAPYVNIEFGGPEIYSRRFRKTLGKSSIPFIGVNCAIQKITGEKNEVLYANSLILGNYDLDDEGEINSLRKTTFGNVPDLKLIKA